MDEQLSDYQPLCDIKDCQQTRCGTPFEGFMQTRFRTVKLPVRVMPCSMHLKQLRELAVRVD